MTREALAARLRAELQQQAPAGARSVAAELARRGGSSTAAVLYYGSAMRADSLEGILDFYVLVDSVSAWPGSLPARLANRILPPNVGYLEYPFGGATLRAKYAVMDLRQFERRVAPASIDTTIWARFCQPALVLWSRSQADLEKVSRLASEATITAARWAARLGPEAGSTEEFWRALFARTYAAELRVEDARRARDIVGRDPARYRILLLLAWSAGGIEHRQRGDGKLAPVIAPFERKRALSAWRWRERLGRPLNVLRLLKASFTFEGAMDYAAWKVERHSGVRVQVKPWQRRFPLLAAPGLYWKLRRKGVLRK